jgi:hypothetical protein
MIVCLLMVMVRNGKQSSLTITINKQPIISHRYHQQTIISHHYHQQTNNHLSPLTSTNKQSSLTITINWLFVDGNGEI